MKVRSNPFLGAMLALFSSIPASQAANFYWDGTTVVVNGASEGGSAAWTVGAPGWEDGASAQNWADGNLAIFGGAGGSVTVGGPISVLGIEVGASAAAYSVTASARQVLTLGTSGITLAGATFDLPLNNLTLAVGGNSQTWNVPSGRNLFLSATNALNGQLTGTNAATITVSGGGMVDLLTNGTGLGGYAGNWLIQGGSTLRTIRNNAAALGTGTVTLNGGTLATGGFQGSGAQGNWTFNNPIILGTAGTNIIDNQLPTGGTPGNRWLKLDGAISGDGSLTFRNSQFVNGVMTSDENGFILTAANSFTGSITIEPNAFLRIGGSATGVTDANAGNNGSIAPSAAISNSGVLRLTRNDAWTLANAISGDGQVKIGGASGTTTSQVATLSGTSTYTGATTVINGTLNLTGSLASPVTVNSGARLRGSGSTSDLLTMAGGSTLLLAGDATTASIAANGVTFAGPASLLFATPPLASTVYDVFTYGDGIVTDIANLSVLYRGTLTDDTANKKYTFTAGGVGTRTWNAAANDGYWDNGIAPNWLEGDNFFFGGDTAIFGEISADAPIQLDGKLAPASVTVNNSTNTYTFTGLAGVSEITGTTSLTKNNGGTLAIASQQSYTGGTTINGGILDLTGGGGASGVIRGTVTVNTGGTLQLSTNDATGFGTDATRLSVINLVGGTLNVNTTLNQTLGSTVINMTGASITGITGSNIDLFANGSVINTLAAATPSAISVPSMNLRQNDTAFSIADGAASVDLQISSNLGNGSAGNHNLIKNGAGSMVLSGANTYTGATTVAGGALTISGATSDTSAVTVNGGASLVVATGGSLTTTGGLGTAIATGANITVETGATLSAASALIAWNPATFRIDGALNVTGALTVSPNATASLTGAGTISAGSFSVGNAPTVVNYSTAAMNVTGLIKLGTTTATHSTTFNQTAGIVTAGGLQLGDAASTVAQTYTLTGGTLNIGSTGIFRSGLGTRTLSLGSATVGATSPWSSNLPITLASTTTGTTFDTTGGTIDLSNTLSGDGAKLVKSGTGTLILGGVNTYTGDTTVNAGTLAVTGSSIANSGRLFINTGGKVDASGTEVVENLFLGGAAQVAGTYGSTTSSATFKNDTYFSGTGVVSVTSGAVGGGYSDWAAANAGGGTASGDFDNDGVSNGVEYVLGGLGTTNESGKLPTISAAGANMVFTFVRDQDSKTSETAVRIEVGNTLVTWPASYTVGNNTASSSPGVTVTDNANGTETIQLTVPQAPDARKFARLRVDVNP